jgi:FlaA1/EpsC-like NDP-sugar epimerase
VPLIIPIRLLLLRYYDLYRVRGEFSFVDDAARVFKAIAISSLLIVAAAFMYRGGTAFRTYSYSRGIFVLDFLLAFGSIAFVRMVFRAGQIMVRRRGINLIPTLIVGSLGPKPRSAFAKCEARPELGYRVIGNNRQRRECRKRVCQLRRRARHRRPATPAGSHPRIARE